MKKMFLRRISDCKEDLMAGSMRNEGKIPWRKGQGRGRKNSTARERCGEKEVRPGGLTCCRNIHCR